MIIKGESREKVVSIRYAVNGIKCDCCGNIIKPPEERNQFIQNTDRYKYYEVTTGHHDWGRDSVDSIQHRDICPGCILKFTSNYLRKGGQTSYIEIEPAYLRFDMTVDE